MQKQARIASRPGHWRERGDQYSSPTDATSFRAQAGQFTLAPYTIDWTYFFDESVAAKSHMKWTAYLGKIVVRIRGT
jgi:hypothetical protein